MIKKILVTYVAFILSLCGHVHSSHIGLDERLSQTFSQDPGMYVNEVITEVKNRTKGAPGKETLAKHVHCAYSLRFIYPEPMDELRRESKSKKIKVNDDPLSKMQALRVMMRSGTNMGALSRILFNGAFVASSVYALYTLPTINMLSVPAHTTTGYLLSPKNLSPHLCQSFFKYIATVPGKSMALVPAILPSLVLAGNAVITVTHLFTGVGYPDLWVSPLGIRNMALRDTVFNLQDGHAALRTTNWRQRTFIAASFLGAVALGVGVTYNLSHVLTGNYLINPKDANIYDFFSAQRLIEKVLPSDCYVIANWKLIPCGHDFSSLNPDDYSVLKGTVKHLSFFFGDLFPIFLPFLLVLLQGMAICIGLI